MARNTNTTSKATGKGKGTGKAAAPMAPATQPAPAAPTPAPAPVAAPTTTAGLVAQLVTEGWQPVGAPLQTGVKLAAPNGCMVKLYPAAPNVAKLYAGHAGGKGTNPQTPKHRMANVGALYTALATAAGDGYNAGADALVGKATAFADRAGRLTTAMATEYQGRGVGLSAAVLRAHGLTEVLPAAAMQQATEASATTEG